MAGSQVSAGSLAPDDDDECHHRKTDDPVSRGGDGGGGTTGKSREEERKEMQRGKTFSPAASCLGRPQCQEACWLGCMQLAPRP